MAADATMAADAFAAAPTQSRPTGSGREVGEVSIASGRRWWRRKRVLITAATLTVVAIVVVGVAVLTADKQQPDSRGGEPGWTFGIGGPQVSVEPPDPALRTKTAVLDLPARFAVTKKLEIRFGKPITSRSPLRGCCGAATV
jgi:hypothetical protein